MKNSLMSIADKILLRKRALIETVNDELKNIEQREKSLPLIRITPIQRKAKNDTQNDTFEYFPNRYMFVTYYTTDLGEENTIYTVVKITKDELYLNNNENFKINWNDLINGHVGCKLYSM